MGALRLFDVTVRWASGSESTSSIYAKSAAAARYDAFRSDAFNGVTFREFLGFSRVRSRSGAPSGCGYDYVRRQYGLDVRIGQRVAIKDEGPRHDGREGEVAYPGESTAYVHVIMDGEERISRFHPDSIVILSDPPLPARSSTSERENVA